MIRNAVIHSSGMYVPERIIPNSYFDELLGENVSEWLEKVVEIKERRWCDDNQSTSDLAAEAAKQAMQRGNVDPESIDLLIVATDTPEFISPSTASKVQYMLGLKNAGTFDLNSACAGFVTALDMAAKYIRSDENYKTVLIVGAYAMSKYLNRADKKTVNLFADGAGAFILKAKDNTDEGWLAGKLITKGEYFDYMGIYAGGTHQPISQEVLEENDHLLKIGKKFPKEINPKTWSEIARYLSKTSGVQLNEVKQYLFSQINIMSIRETMDILELPHSKAHTGMHLYGYTGSACIPLAFEEALIKGKIKRGDTVFFIGSGGGLAFAGAAFRY